jgi:hypothetical protein
MAGAGGTGAGAGAGGRSRSRSRSRAWSGRVRSGGTGACAPPQSPQPASSPAGSQDRDLRVRAVPRLPTRRPRSPATPPGARRFFRSPAQESATPSQARLRSPPLLPKPASEARHSFPSPPPEPDLLPSPAHWSPVSPRTRPSPRLRSPREPGRPNPTSPEPDLPPPEPNPPPPRPPIPAPRYPRLTPTPRDCRCPGIS